MPQAEGGKCEANDIVVEAIVSALSLGKKKEANACNSSCGKEETDGKGNLAFA